MCYIFVSTEKLFSWSCNFFIWSVRVVCILSANHTFMWLNSFSFFFIIKRSTCNYYCVLIRNNGDLCCTQTVQVYMTALGIYNIISFKYETNQDTHAHTHTHTTYAHECTHMHTHSHTWTFSKKFVRRKIRLRNKRRFETLLKEMGFQSLSKWCLRVRMAESVW